MPSPSNTKPSHKQSIPETRTKGEAGRNILRKGKPGSPKKQGGGGGGKGKWNMVEDQIAAEY